MLTLAQYFAAVECGDAHTIAAFLTQQSLHPHAYPVEHPIKRRAGVEWLLPLNPEVSCTSRWTLLGTAIALGHIKVLEWLFSDEAMATIDTARLVTALSQACSLIMRRNKLTLLESLLASPVFTQLLPPNEQQTLLDNLLCSIDEIHGADMVHLLVAHGACVNTTDATRTHTALRQSAAAHKPELVTALLYDGAFAVGARVFDRGFVADPHTLGILLPHGAGCTLASDASPLHRAAASWVPAAATQAWLALGFADVDARNTRQQTPLMLATWVGGTRPFVGRTSGADRAVLTTQMLLDYGASVSATDEQGWTPLRHAIRAEFPEVVRLLLLHGADPNQPTEGGHVVLDWLDFSRLDRKRIASHLRNLLAFGADPFTRGKDGLSAVDRLQQTDTGKAFMDAHPQWFKGPY